MELTDANFKERLSGATGIIFFHKKICPNCKALRKVIEKFETANTGVLIMEIDSEENPGAMEDMAVEKVPTVLVIKNGRVVARKVGLMNVKEMTALYQKS